MWGNAEGRRGIKTRREKKESHCEGKVDEGETIKTRIEEEKNNKERENR